MIVEDLEKSRCRFAPIADEIYGQTQYYPRVTLVTGDVVPVDVHGLLYPWRGIPIGLPPIPAQVIACERWLQRAIADGAKQKTPTISSYALKHSVERFERRQGRDGYIPNGALIAAAGRLGFVMRPPRNQPGSINVCVAVSRKWYDGQVGVKS